MIKIKKLLRSRLSQKRYDHSLRVAKTSLKIAVKYNLNFGDKKKLYIASLLHDLLKESSPRMLKKENWNLDNYLEDTYDKFPQIWHGFMAAKLIKNLKIQNKKIINAIKNHSTGNKNMDIISQILFIADAVEPGRNYVERKQIYQIAEKNLNQATSIIINNLIKVLKIGNKKIHPNSLKCHSFYNEI